MIEPEPPHTGWLNALLDEVPHRLVEGSRLPHPPRAKDELEPPRGVLHEALPQHPRQRPLHVARQRDGYDA